MNITNFIEALALCLSTEGKQLDSTIAEIQAINYAKSQNEESVGTVNPLDRIRAN